METNILFQAYQHFFQNHNDNYAEALKITFTLAITFSFEGQEQQSQ